MRIVYVITSLGMGGAERQVLGLADRMAARGHAVALLVLRPRLAEEWPTGLDVFRLGMRMTPLSVLAGLLRGRRFLNDFRPDLVHSHSFHANLVARLLKITQPATVVLSTVHNVYEGGWARMLAYRLSDGLSRRTTAVCGAAVERFVRLRAVPLGKCAVVTNGIDGSEFQPDLARRMEMRDAMIAKDDFIWLAAGRIVPAKDFPNLLGAFRLVRERSSRTQLWVAGEWPGGGAEGVEGDGVRWLGLRRDMAAVYDAADGFVLASRWEGMPLVVAEAMAMEKPVVATDVGGVRELVGDDAVLVAARDTDALAEAMIDVMRRTDEERAEMGRAGRGRVLERFIMDAKADEWEGIYRSLAEPAIVKVHPPGAKARRPF
jgi:glycosyltransferase involved in cell wall biosynthesis